ncbi:hypothetical protein QOZ96_000686 [Brevundimonas nasdae]|uniref:hypothetical protein n=1 Tax=Brevundimonas nasdae TaxID=172043 RepID=UPI001914309E|nr:hypothetical protein [Brevundimonas nasdae]MBK6024100.1 hypothetical protein [Brevundimonas nasdae]MDQ0450755.1 hypothetical protein [Brevundimonas nasdae]
MKKRFARLFAPAKPSPNGGVNLRWPAAGVAVVTAISLALIALDGGCKLSPSEGCRSVIVPVTTIAWSWQSLLGAIFTLLAAVYGAWFVLRQIQQNDQQEQDRKARRLRAQRAAMPLVMSDVCEFAEQSVERLKRALPVARQYGSVTGNRFTVRAPRLASDAVKEITAMIEAADGAEADAYIDLLAELQVHLARWRSFKADLTARRKGRVPRDIEVEFVDAAEIYARASNLLAIARPARQPEEGPMSRRSAMTVLGLHDAMYDDAKGYAERMDGRTPLSLPDDGDATLAGPAAGA